MQVGDDRRLAPGTEAEGPPQQQEVEWRLPLLALDHVDPGALDQQFREARGAPGKPLRGHAGCQHRFQAAPGDGPIREVGEIEMGISARDPVDDQAIAALVFGLECRAGPALADHMHGLTVLG
jgi:hypothetical protein